ncbi:MAG: glucose-6-phosphate isomerase [Oscillospiraceae bacterium]|nr:glucose-6-phosphate isomerase [Oscillospiraceae bacterium]
MLRYDVGLLDGFLTRGEFDSIKEEIVAASAALREGSGRGNDFIGWRDLPAVFDREEYARIKLAAERIRSQSGILLVIGIGGSYLGARAVLELIRGELHNETGGLRVYFTGNSLSPGDLEDLLKLCDTADVSINVISKSGTTTEPAVAFRIFRDYLIKRYGEEESRKRIYATTDRTGGTLRKLSEEQGYETFIIPGDVGGRFSVLTPVGLLPLAAAGIDTDALLKGAEDMMKTVCSDDTLANPTNRYAAVRNLLLRSGKSVEILSCFEPRFRMMGEWYKQLFGESEGKEHKGLFPSTCVFTSDLHSMGQYCQDGSRIIFETLVKFAHVDSGITVNREEEDFDGLNYLAGRKIHDINTVASDATMSAHTEGGVPCSVIECEKLDEYNVGELIYFFERACAVSGYTLGVNPFDQNGVEAYKRNMFALLDKPGYEEDKKRLLEKR